MVDPVKFAAVLVVQMGVRGGVMDVRHENMSSLSLCPRKRGFFYIGLSSELSDD